MHNVKRIGLMVSLGVVLLGTLVAPSTVVRAQGAPVSAQIQRALAGFLQAAHTWTGTQTFSAIVVSGCTGCGGGATVPGSTTQVLFNDASAFGANANLTFNKATSVLGLTGTFTFAGDTSLSRGTGAGTVKLTAATTSNTFSVVNGSNAEVGAIGWSGNAFIVGTQGGVNGGTARDTILGSAAGATNGIYFATEGASRWQVASTGLLRPFTDNTIAIGDASHRVSNLYAALTNATGLPLATGVTGNLPAANLPVGLTYTANVLTVGVAGSPTDGQTIRIAPSTGTNQNGADFILQAGLQTGSGLEGQIRLQSPIQVENARGLLTPNLDVVGTLYVYDVGSINSAFFSLDGTAHQLNLNLMAGGTVGGLRLDALITLLPTTNLTVDEASTLTQGLSIYSTINGTSNLTSSSTGADTVNLALDYYNSGTANGIAANTTFVYQEDGTVNGTNSYGGVVGQWTGAFTYGGTTTRLIGLFATASNYGGTTGRLAAFWAGAPDPPSGTVTGESIAYFNENWGAGGFAWYSEGGTLHAETGHANNVGVEVIAAASQAADLQRWLASDETTVLAKVDKDGKLTVADVLITGGSSIKPLAGVTGSIGGGLLSAGACASGTASITGARSTMGVVSTPTSYPGDGADWEAYVSADDVVTVKVCGLVAVTPTSSTYQVRVTP